MKETIEYQNIYEHQSSRNENMPLRGFLYFAKMFENYISENDIDLFSRRIQKIPTPKYIVFYNGRVHTKRYFAGYSDKTKK